VKLLNLFLSSKKFSSKHKKYFHVYEEVFSNYINKKIIFVEVGILNGGSLKMWKEYFGQNVRIIGTDYNPECKKYEEEGIEIFIGDQSDPKFWDDFFSKVGKVDILLDDGGHTNSQQVITTVKAIPNIKDGGLLVTEDTHASYQAIFNNPSKKSYINFTKKLIDDINFTFPNLGKFKYSFNKYVYSLRYFESFVVFYIDREKACLNEVIFNNQLPPDLNEDFRYHNSIAKKIRVSLKNKLKDFYLIKKFKPLLKIIFFKFNVLIKFFENRKEIKKYKKYFD
jgi:hypothetical protein